ncbi:MAG TPA: hypothetical protein VFE02_11980 [Candidatus Acidoferrales bacterium]|jgi:hypothetical protein|nr:hypothetical protein [Candidatus Acidoferrales bacterium]
MDEHERELSFMQGMVHGYAIAKGLQKSEKRKLQRVRTADIAKGLTKLGKRFPEHKIFEELAKGMANSKKRKPDHKTKMLQVLLKDPKATPMKAARALDSAGIRLPKVNSLKKGKTLWKDIVETRYFNVLFRRTCKRVVREKHLRDCQERLELIRMGAGVKMADILDFDTPLQPD